jgi:hypothetical protein
MSIADMALSLYAAGRVPDWRRNHQIGSFEQALIA